MLIHPGTQEKLIAESTSGAGTTSREGSIQSDSLVATLWVNSVTSGSLSVSVYTLTDTGKEVVLFSFPVLTATTVNLLLRKSGISLQRFRVAATYTGQCDYEIYIRAVEGAGESNSRISGASSFTTSQITIGTSPTILIASSLIDRQGLVIKNWGTGGDLFISESSGKLSGQAWPLGPKDALALDVSAGVDIFAVASTGTIDVRLAQAGG